MIIQKYLNEPHESIGAFVSLFDRLVDNDLDQRVEFPVYKFYSLDQLKSSIQEELMHIIETQSKFKEKNYKILVENPLNYAVSGMFGVPELTMYDGSNTNHWRIFARYMTKVISIFEPRLKNIVVTINGFDNSKQFLNLTIFAHIIFGTFREEATFSLRLVKRKR